MTLTDRIRARLISWLDIKATSYPSWFDDSDGAAMGLPRLYDTRAQASTYTWSSWVVSALNMVAQTIKSPEFHVMSVTGEKNTEQVAHPVERLLQAPNPLYGANDFRESMFNWRLLTGDCYVWLNRAGETAPVAEMWILPSYEVQPHPDGRLSVDGYEYRPSGSSDEPIFLPLWQVMHWHGFSPFTPFAGASFVQVLDSTINTDEHQSKWNERNFGKNQGKVPGILAFPDFIADPLWEKMQAEFYKDKRGARRHVMLMRGTGASTPKWVPTYMSPAEMEFLDSRRWNREEIYSVLAPGLHTMLSENSTEANSRVGKEVFATFCWGMLVGLAESLGRSVLPAYGDNLRATFDDIRITDRIVEMKEQELFAVSHTVQEIREEFYEDKPLGDDRDNMLPVQIGLYAEAANEDMPPAEQDAAEVDQTPAREPAETATEPERADTTKALIDADMYKWRRKAKRRPDAAFESAVIPEWQHDAIEMRLAAQPATAFDPFLKASALPGRLERTLQRELERIYAGYLPTIQAAVEAGETPGLTMMYTEIRSQAELTYYEAMTDELLSQADELAWGIDYNEVMDEAQSYAEREADRLIGQISQTDAKYLTQVSNQVAEGKITAEAAAQMLAGTFGARRAETIASTEVTTALQAASDKLQANLKESGIESVQRWLTEEDERVCPICGPLDHTTEETWRQSVPSGPPAHVHCRCRTVVEYIKARRR